MYGEKEETRAKMEKIRARFKDEADQRGIKMNHQSVQRTLSRHAVEHDETRRLHPVDNSGSTEERLDEVKEKFKKGGEKIEKVRETVTIDPDASRWI